MESLRPPSVTLWRVLVAGGRSSGRVVQESLSLAVSLLLPQNPKLLASISSSSSESSLSPLAPALFSNTNPFRGTAMELDHSPIPEGQEALDDLYVRSLVLPPML